MAAYPLNEKADEDELDPLVLVLLPVALLVGFLALISIFSKFYSQGNFSEQKWEIKFKIFSFRCFF